MNRATLIVNAVAGRRKDLRALIPELVQILEQRGVQATAKVTTMAGEAQTIAANAATSGCDAVFACGGDGTAHEALQGIVGTACALGVVPLGTANALARNLGLPLDPAQALWQQLGFVPRAISVGEAHCIAKDGEARRYFTVMAGAGPDGALVYRTLAGRGSKFGRGIYYTHAVRLFLTRRFPAFQVEFRRRGSDEWEQRLAVSIMCARVADLGGIFSRLTRGGSLLDTELELVLVKPPAGIGLPAWFALNTVGLHARNPWVETVRVTEFRCVPLTSDQPVHAEVDGEWIGYLPMSVRLIPQAAWMLMPKEVAAETVTS
ncbi:diacylglycerol/lipid kinase family protein [Tunturiibacter lichenicola]|uniref:diacylglycerol/lipid kinase family protein n=1 Tax=Tunturiibacter lichenicola TaxID=2051959 RepID=UPI003D9B3774